MARAIGTCCRDDRGAVAKRLRLAGRPEPLPAGRARVNDRDEPRIQDTRSAAAAIHLRRPGSQSAPLLVGSLLAAATIVRGRRGRRPGADYPVCVLDRVRHQPDPTTIWPKPPPTRAQEGKDYAGTAPHPPPGP